MNGSARLCSVCAFWDHHVDSIAEGQREGTCRRFPPVGGTAQGAGVGRIRGIGWPRTRDQDWCGEWAPREMPAVDDEEDRQLRNISMAQAMLTLPEDKRDRMLREILTDEELADPCPPDDFYDRVQDYFAKQRGESKE